MGASEKEVEKEPVPEIKISSISEESPIYDFNLVNIKGKNISFEIYKHKVLLIVNLD